MNTEALNQKLKSGLRKYGLFKLVQNLVRLPYRNRKTFVATLDGIDVHFSTEDDYSNRWFYPRYRGGRIHEKIVSEMLVKAVKQVDCFIDIGSNLGWYTCLAAKHMDDGIVYGFEMDDLNFELLEKNIQLNGCTNVEVHNVAVSDTNGKVSYQRNSGNPSPTFKIDLKGQAKGLVTANSISMDEFVAERGIAPKLMKIDVEGAEMLVLLGMKTILREHKPIVFLEIHPDNLINFGSSASQVVSLLRDYDYQIFEIEEMRYQSARGNKEPLSEDSVLVHNGMLYAVPQQ